MHEEQTEQRNKSLSIIQGSALGSLLCDVQLKLQRSSPSQGHPTAPSKVPRQTHHSWYQQLVQLIHLSLPTAARERKIYKYLLHHYHQYRSLVLNPKTSTSFTKIRRQNKIQNCHGSCSTAWVDTQTSNNIILNSSLKIINTADPHSIFVTFQYSLLHCPFTNHEEFIDE